MPELADQDRHGFGAGVLLHKAQGAHVADPASQPTHAKLGFVLHDFHLDQGVPDLVQYLDTHHKCLSIWQRQLVVLPDVFIPKWTASPKPDAGHQTLHQNPKRLNSLVFA